MTWQDPYGQPGWQGNAQPGWQGNAQPGWQGNAQPGWQDPYAQPGYGYGPPGGPPRASNGAAIGALIANIIAAIFCFGGIAWLPGVILAAIAINRTQRDPESARRLTVWAWVCLAIDVVLTIVLVVVLIAAGAFETRNV